MVRYRIAHFRINDSLAHHNIIIESRLLVVLNNSKRNATQQTRTTRTNEGKNEARTFAGRENF